MATARASMSTCVNRRAAAAAVRCVGRSAVRPRRLVRGSAARGNGGNGLARRERERIGRGRGVVAGDAGRGAGGRCRSRRGLRCRGGRWSGRRRRLRRDLSCAVRPGGARLLGHATELHGRRYLGLRRGGLLQGEVPMGHLEGGLLGVVRSGSARTGDDGGGDGERKKSQGAHRVLRGGDVLEPEELVTTQPTGAARIAPRHIPPVQVEHFFARYRHRDRRRCMPIRFGRRRADRFPGTPSGPHPARSHHVAS